MISLLRRCPWGNNRTDERTFTDLGVYRSDVNTFYTLVIEYGVLRSWIRKAL